MRILLPVPVLTACLLAVGCSQPERVPVDAMPVSELDAPNGCSDGVDNDGDDRIDCMDSDCITQCSADNWPPEVQSVHIEPASPDTRDPLTCVAEANDQDGDPISWSYAWFRDGAWVADGPDLPADHTVGYDTWTCEATPTDGIDVGLSADAQATVLADDACTSAHFALTGEILVPRLVGQDLAGTDFTVEAWVRVDAAGGSTLPILDSDPRADLSGWRFSVVGDAGQRTVHFQLGGGTPGVPAYEGVRTVPDGAWSHVAVTYDQQDGALRGYIDGTPAGSATVGPMGVGASVGDLVLGGSPSAGFQYLGHLDEVRISTTVRYTTDFLPRMWFEPDADTLALWHLDEGAGTVTLDEVGGADAALSGVAWDAGRSACDAY